MTNNNQKSDKDPLQRPKIQLKPHKGSGVVRTPQKRSELVAAAAGEAGQANIRFSDHGGPILSNVHWIRMRDKGWGIMATVLCHKIWKDTLLNGIPMRVVFLFLF
jgi:hypothetical protein